MKMVTDKSTGKASLRWTGDTYINMGDYLSDFMVRYLMPAWVVNATNQKSLNDSQVTCNLGGGQKYTVTKGTTGAHPNTYKKSNKLHNLNFRGAVPKGNGNKDEPGKYS